jgi:hypothetical protein
MSDNWEDFMDARDGLERKVYHFYWDRFHLFMIKDNDGNILAGTGHKTWDELYGNPALQKTRTEKLDDLHRVRREARKEKKEGKARIIIHEEKKFFTKKKLRGKKAGK